MKLEMTAGLLAGAAGGRLARGGPGVKFDAFVTDSRRLRPGDFFWALKGDSRDGHAYLPVTLAGEPGGWVAAEEALRAQPETPPVVVAVPDTLIALQRLAAWHRRRFSVPVAAVAGSNGKTTTKEMLRSVFSAAGAVCASPASFNNRFGLPLSLLELLPAHQYAVFELGAVRRGDIRGLCALARPDIGILTSIGPEHLESFGDLEGVFEAETELADGLAPGGTLVYNCDDPYLSRLSGRAQKKLSFGRSAGADVRILPARDLLLECAAGRVRARLPRPCGRNYYNAAAAAAAALAAGLGPREIAAGLENYSPPPMRLQELRFGGAAVILDAYNANPDSMAAALAEMAGRPRPRYYLLGDMKELGRHSPGYHAQLGAALAGAGAEAVFLAGPEMKTAVEAYYKAGGRCLVYGPSLEVWLAEARRLIGRGEGTFLIKASRSMRFERIVEGLAAPAPGTDGDKEKLA
jgi:UDP-N-acetylmuramoyl-tripeptide--D-alanyl-D-alanine ligase